MAQLLVSGDATVPNALSAYLREALPGNFIVVSDPVVQGCAADAIAVGPGGLTLIAGEGRPAADQPEPRRHPSATGSPEDAAVAALRAFLKDTFPTLAALIRYITAVPDPDAEPPLWRAVDFIGAGQEELAEAVVRIQAADPIALDDPGMREAVAAALHERRLSVNQRTTRPFVFRGGGLLGTRARAWTIHDAVKHMDQRPEDGIYHLTNGTLAQWLDEEGAADLAALARHAVDAGRADRRKALEVFLVGTGLAARPRLKTRPKALDLGYAISGEKVAGRIRLGRGRGRGYLYGELEPGVPWLEVQPRSFAGGAVDLAVTADTHTLQITPTPYEETIVVHSNAATEPIGLPVRLRMVGTPAPVNRFLHRPFAALILGVLLGGLAGWLWAQVAPPLPPQLTVALNVSPTLAWVLLVAALWGIIGLVRGALQPPAWPILYVTRRWLVRLAIWAAILALAGYGTAVWWQRNFGLPGGSVGQLGIQAALIGVMLANIPASMTALRRPAATAPSKKSAASFATAAEPLPNGVSSWPREHSRGLAWGAVAVVVLILVLLFAPRLARTEWAGVRSQGEVVAAQGWAETQWARLNAAIDGAVNRYYLRRYDRRAPLEPTPAASPTPKATPTPRVTPAPTRTDG
jgi:hypothetical protein